MNGLHIASPSQSPQLSLSNSTSPQHDVDEWIRQLRENETVSIVFRSGTVLTAATVNALRAALRDNFWARHLSFSGVRLTLPVSLSGLVVENLQNHHNLCYLCLSNANIRDTDVEMVLCAEVPNEEGDDSPPLTYLETLVSLTRLDLSHNALTDKGAVELVFRDIVRSEFLLLGDDDDYDDDGIDAGDIDAIDIEPMDFENGEAGEIDLLPDAINPEAEPEVVETDQTPPKRRARIQYMDLSYNRIGLEGLKSLHQAQLLQDCSLVIVDVRSQQPTNPPPSGDEQFSETCASIEACNASILRQARFNVALQEKEQQLSAREGGEDTQAQQELTPQLYDQFEVVRIRIWESIIQQQSLPTQISFPPDAADEVDAIWGWTVYMERVLADRPIAVSGTDIRWYRCVSDPHVLHHFFEGRAALPPTLVVAKSSEEDESKEYLNGDYKAKQIIASHPNRFGRELIGRVPQPLLFIPVPNGPSYLLQADLRDGRRMSMNGENDGEGGLFGMLHVQQQLFIALDIAKVLRAFHQFALYLGLARAQVWIPVQIQHEQQQGLHSPPSSPRPGSAQSTLPPVWTQMLDLGHSHFALMNRLPNLDEQLLVRRREDFEGLAMLLRLLAASHPQSGLAQNAIHLHDRIVVGAGMGSIGRHDNDAVVEALETVISHLNALTEAVRTNE